MKRIIYHVPIILDYRSNSAPNIRPIKMLKAFKDLGYEVDEISGNECERNSKIKIIRRNIKNGIKYDFMYSETSSLPTLLSEKNHIPKYLILDYRLFFYCKRHLVPISIFYRDIYWNFSEYKKELSAIKYYLLKYLYMIDLYIYKNTVKKIYLPSMEMKKYIPIIKKNIFDELPPGCENKRNIPDNRKKNYLSIIYVGGIGVTYPMQILFDSLINRKDELLICTRKSEWDEYKKSYQKCLSSNIKIFHKTNNELSDIYKISDLASLFIKPSKIREFAVPFKLFEYISYGIPIIATKGTLVGKYVEKYDIGFTIDYSRCALKDLLDYLNNNKKIIAVKKSNIESIRDKCSWVERAKKVKNDMAKYKEIYE